MALGYLMVTMLDLQEFTEKEKEQLGKEVKEYLVSLNIQKRLQKEL